MNIVDKNFKSAINELEAFFSNVNSSNNKNLLIISLKRNNNYVYQKKIEVFKDGYNDEYNFYIVERIIKSILWVVGGYKLYIAGSHKIYSYIASLYKDKGLRDFDYHFMSRIYNHPFEVIEASYENIPSPNEEYINISNNNSGKRIGFDAGGSDIKICSIENGKNIYSEEIIWHPKLNNDPSYHINIIYNAFKKAISKLGGDVDTIGVSSAGIYIDNKTMIASLFIKISEEDFNKYIKNIYIDITKRFEKELGHPITLKVINDGDVSALAGAFEINDTNILGIALGTSEASGYINESGQILGWLNELAFVPIDFSKNATKDEWSLDYGVGAKYLSQDGVIRLAKLNNIKIDESKSLAEQLKYIQFLINNGDKYATEVYENMGIYLANAIMYYTYFYNIKHVMLLGRVMSGLGGDIIIKKCKEILSTFPYINNISLHTPNELNRRLGQSLAASSLPKL